ncbi:hypothetical protein [Isoptericola sp. 178]|uniref:hypothetical protein n=1 Tax=Isoptericola sp. 178 TaxID=3064651 RepID=UPI002712D5DB|nr:hypothetical protein [Isoptericola sp. 178]MDO8145102.1 hypothetical protein [Isoptericola sp. 178]
MAIISMTAMLVVAVLLEDADPASGEPLGSISAAWYTPAQSVFVAVLVATGAAMIAIRGRGTQEPLLNLAGFLAPVVAFVPTPEPVREACFGRPTPDSLVAEQPPVGGGPWDAQACAEWTNQVESSLEAYFLVSSVALVLLLFFVVLRDRPPEPLAAPGGSRWRRLLDTGYREPSRNEEVVGTLVVIGLWLAGLAVYLTLHEWFLLNAHAVAAILVFTPMALVALIGGFGARRHPGRGDSVYRGIYVLVAIAMVCGIAGTAGFKLLGWVGDDSRWFYVLEFVIVGGFLLFWTTQTVEERGASRGGAGRHDRSEVTPSGLR